MLSPLSRSSAFVSLLLVMCVCGIVSSHGSWCLPGQTSCFDGDCPAREDPSQCWLKLPPLFSYGLCSSFCWYDWRRCNRCTTQHCDGCLYNCNTTVITMPPGYGSTCAECADGWVGLARGCDAPITCTQHGTPDRDPYSFGHCKSCEAGWWGLDCEHQCLCADPATCDGSTGGCACPAGSHQATEILSDTGFRLLCQACRPGYHMPSASAPTTSSYDCLVCPDGLWSEANATTCDDMCPTGHTCSSGVMLLTDDGSARQRQLLSLLLSGVSLLVAILKFAWDIFTIRRKYPNARISCRLFWRESLPWGERCVRLPDDVETATGNMHERHYAQLPAHTTRGAINNA